jgi:type VI protein secretion system component VasK
MTSTQKELIAHLFTASMLVLMLGLLAMSYFGDRDRTEAVNRNTQATEEFTKATRENTQAMQELAVRIENFTMETEP